MRFVKAAIALLMLLCVLPRVVYAQGAVLQSKPVVPGHLAKWVANGVIADAGNQSLSGPCTANPCVLGTGLNVDFLTIGGVPAITMQPNGTIAAQLDLLQGGSVMSSLGNQVPILNGGNTGLAQTYLGSAYYNNGSGFQLIPNGRIQINGQGRGWERQTCTVSIQVFPPLNETNGCGQGNFYSFPIRYTYPGQDAEALHVGASGVTPVATGVGISSVTPITITNAAGLAQQVYQVNFASPLSGSQISAIKALSGSRSQSLPVRVETSNQFSAYILPGSWGSTPSVDPSGNYIVVDCFTRPIPSVPEGPDPTPPITPAPPTANNACPLPTDFGYGLWRFTNTADTAQSNQTLTVTSTTSRAGAAKVPTGLNITVDGAAAGATTQAVGSTTITMSLGASAKIPAGREVNIMSPTVRTFATTAANGTTITVNATTENLSYVIGAIASGWHVWGYGVPYGTTVTGVSGNDVSVSNPVVVAQGNSSCTTGVLGSPGPGCLTFQAPSSTALTLAIDVVHLSDSSYFSCNIRDTDLLLGGSCLELVTVNSMSLPPAFGINPLDDLPLRGGIFAGAAGQASSYALFVPTGHKRGIVLDNAEVAGSGPTYGIYSESPDVSLYSIQPTGKFLILENQGGTSPDNQVTLTTDGALTISGFATVGGLLEAGPTTPPSSTGTSCAAGSIVWDVGFVYVCVATNTWKRTALSTW